MNKMILLTGKIVVGMTIVITLYFVLGWLVRTFVRLLEKKVSKEMGIIIDYVVFYGIYFIILIVVLTALGVDLSYLVATAGIAGIAIGFAAQTSLSNIISGIMLVFERAFRLEDYISCEGLEGKVEEVNLFSILLRTEDNRFIRIPNEHLFKSNLINLTSLQERMLTFILTVDVKENMEKVRQLIEKMVLDAPYRLPEKPIDIVFWGSSLQSVFSTPELMQTVHFKVRFWVKVSDILAAKSAFTLASVKVAREQKPIILSAIHQE